MGTARYFPQGFGSAAVEAPLSPRGRAYIVAGVAVLSAFTVFLSLCERDNWLLLSATGQNHPTLVRKSVAPRGPVAAAETQTSSGSITRVTVPTVNPLPPSPAVGLSNDSDVVAKSHSELVALEKRGLRRYVEFTLARSKRLQRIGPVSVGVWRIDARHKLYDVAVLADGHRLFRKHVGLNSPVSISIAEFGRPLQLVVNAMDRDGVSGYLSEPQTAR